MPLQCERAEDVVECDLIHATRLCPANTVEISTYGARETIGRIEECTSVSMTHEINLLTRLDGAVPHMAAYCPSRHARSCPLSITTWRSATLHQQLVLSAESSPHRLLTAGGTDVRSDADATIPCGTVRWSARSNIKHLHSNIG